MATVADESHLSLRVTRNSRALLVLLICTAMLQCLAQGYDCSMMNGLNILYTYTNYFKLNSVTTALNTSIIWIGQFVSGPPGGFISDRYGRKNAMVFAATVNIIGSILQATAQNIPMFMVARLLIGIGSGVAFAQVPGYVAEVAAVRFRGLANGLFNCSYLVGALIAAGVTYRLAKMDSTWSWRGPSLIQGLLSFICILLLPFLPESPRWLVDTHRNTEALEVLAAVHTNGIVDSPIINFQYQEIFNTIAFEKSMNEKSVGRNGGRRMAFWELLKLRGTRRRIVILVTLASVSMLSGNNIVSFYLGSMLNKAGIMNRDTQLIINITLNAFSLLVAITGTLLIDKMGRKILGLASMCSMTLFMFLLGALTKLYGPGADVYPGGGDMKGIYATVASIFLFLGAYCFGMTPLNTVYSPEVINYTLRAQGLGFFMTVSSGFGLLVTFGFPIALDRIGWKTYMINGAWDVLQIGMIWAWWVETKGLTMEEVDLLFDDEGFEGKGVELEEGEVDRRVK